MTPSVQWSNLRWQSVASINTIAGFKSVEHIPSRQNDRVIGIFYLTSTVESTEGSSLILVRCLLRPTLFFQTYKNSSTWKYSDCCDLRQWVECPLSTVTSCLRSRHLLAAHHCTNLSNVQDVSGINESSGWVMLRLLVVVIRAGKNTSALWTLQNSGRILAQKSQYCKAQPLDIRNFSQRNLEDKHYTKKGSSYRLPLFCSSRTR